MADTVRKGKIIHFELASNESVIKVEDEEDLVRVNFNEQEYPKGTPVYLQQSEGDDTEGWKVGKPPSAA